MNRALPNWCVKLHAKTKQPVVLLVDEYDKPILDNLFTTATPTFLLDLLQNNQYDLKKLCQFKIGEAAFASTDPENMEVQSVFVQTGYLTIKDYDGALYSLDFPNYEVKKSFYDSVAARYGQGFTVALLTHLNAGDIAAFFDTLALFFANIPYDLAVDREKYYQSLFYAILSLLGLDIEAEVHTNQGSIDCVLQTDDTIYVIEFKLNGTKEEALQQIYDKQYAQKYQGSDKTIVLLGVEFDKKTRNLGGFIQA
ncbi:MAG: PD-(D/E)XK nuclease domain-containing protein [Algicola sp.]|nr:PD-(D/E)XK nuclease domain-containing protein [Algicola sp.]